MREVVDFFCILFLVLGLFQESRKGGGEGITDEKEKVERKDAWDGLRKSRCF